MTYFDDDKSIDYTSNVGHITYDSWSCQSADISYPVFSCCRNHGAAAGSGATSAPTRCFPPLCGRDRGCIGLHKTRISIIGLIVRCGLCIPSELYLILWQFFQSLKL